MIMTHPKNKSALAIAGVICLMWAGHALAGTTNTIRIVENFLAGNEDVAHFGGVGLIETNGMRLIIGVGATDARDDQSPKEVTRQIHVARSDARARIAVALGSTVEIQRLLESTSEKDKLTVWIKEHARSVLPRAKPVKSWKSKDGGIHFEALVVEVALGESGRRQ